MQEVQQEVKQKENQIQRHWFKMKKLLQVYVKKVPHVQVTQLWIS